MAKQSLTWVPYPHDPVSGTLVRTADFAKWRSEMDSLEACETVGDVAEASENLKLAVTPGLWPDDLLDEFGPDEPWGYGEAEQMDADNGDPDNHALRNSPAFWGSHRLRESLIDALVAAGAAEVCVVDPSFGDAWYLEVPDFERVREVAEPLGFIVEKAQ